MQFKLYLLFNKIWLLEVAPSSENHVTVSASYRSETYSNAQSRIIVFSLTYSLKIFCKLLSCSVNISFLLKSSYFKILLLEAFSQL